MIQMGSNKENVCMNNFILFFINYVIGWNRLLLNTIKNKFILGSKAEGYKQKKIH